jgi:hypothetical protein
MLNVAKDIGMTERDIADFSEDDYRVRSLVDKILRRKRIVATSYIRKGDESVRNPLDEEANLIAIQAVIKNLAARGRTVIVGRGGQAILRNKLDVLHVRVVAPLEVRVERIVREAGLGKVDALKYVSDGDKATAEYLRRFYKTDCEDPTVYDIVLNTWKLDYDTAVRAVSSIARKAF